MNPDRRITSLVMPLRYENMSAQGEDFFRPLVISTRLNMDDASVRIALGYLDRKDFCLGGQRIADEHRAIVAYLIISKIGVRLTTDIRDRHPRHETENVSTNHEDLAVLVAFAEFLVEMNRMMIHGEQAKQIVVTLGDRLSGVMLENIARLEILEVMSEGFFPIVKHIGFPFPDARVYRPELLDGSVPR